MSADGRFTLTNVGDPDHVCPLAELPEDAAVMALLAVRECTSMAHAVARLRLRGIVLARKVEAVRNG